MWTVEFQERAEAALDLLKKSERKQLDEALALLPAGSHTRVAGNSEVRCLRIGSLRIHFILEEQRRHVVVRRFFEHGQALDVVPTKNAGRRALVRMAYFAYAALFAIALCVAAIIWLTAPPPVPSGTQTFAERSRSHTNAPVSYDRTPPAGGNHAAQWLNCGVYEKTVPSANAVHSLEHGAVWVTYRPDLSANSVSRLRSLVEGEYVGPQRYVILSPYPGLAPSIVASAWGAQLTLGSPTDARLKQFIDHFRAGPQALEPRALCTRGTGTPQA